MTAAAPVMPLTCTGVEDPGGPVAWSATVPSPSCPSASRPQPRTVAVAGLPGVVPPPARHRPVGQAHPRMRPAGGHGGGGEGSIRRELLRLADTNAGIGGRDRHGVGRPPNENEAKNAQAGGEELQLSLTEVD